MTAAVVKGCPCKHCGSVEKYASTNGCRPCAIRRASNRNGERLEYKKAWARAQRAKDPAKARANDKASRERHAEARREAFSRWRKENPDYWKQHQAANREKYRASYRRWRAANPDKAREATQRWREANWPRVLAMLQRRRARRKGAAGTFTLEQMRARFHYYGGRCWMCGARATCADHVIALCNGGSNWPSNLRPACVRCNSRKGQWEMSGPKTIGEIMQKVRDFRSA